MDLKSSSSGKCKTVATSLESPSLTQTTFHATDEEFFTLTIPSTSSGCPSYGTTFSASDTYTIVVTGIYGNVQTLSSLG